MEHWVSSFAWQIICAVFGLAVGAMIMRLFDNKRLAAMEKRLHKRIDTLERERELPMSGTFNFNAQSQSISIRGQNVKAGIIRGRFKLGYMYVSGQGYMTVLAPEAYLQHPDGSEVPLNFEGFEAPDGVGVTRLLSGIQITMEPDPNSLPSPDK